MLIRTNMEDLREQTQIKHYELYRYVQRIILGVIEYTNKGYCVHMYSITALNHLKF